MEELIDNVGKWGGVSLTDLKNNIFDINVHPKDLYKIQKIRQPIVEHIFEKK